MGDKSGWTTGSKLTQSQPNLSAYNRKQSKDVGKFSPYLPKDDPPGLIVTRGINRRIQNSLSQLASSFDDSDSSSSEEKKLQDQLRKSVSKKLEDL
jgi:hypothetical protein